MGSIKIGDIVQRCGDTSFGGKHPGESWVVKNITDSGIVDENDFTHSHSKVVLVTPKELVKTVQSNKIINNYSIC